MDKRNEFLRWSLSLVVVLLRAIYSASDAIAGKRTSIRVVGCCFVAVANCVVGSAPVNAADFPLTRNDPKYRENAPPAYFPNTSIPPKYPEAKPQTHGLDLSQHDWETAKAYFKWLCENEAGEFIYKTVDNVDSVFEMRRRPDYAQDWRVYDRYYLEDPWGWPVTATGRMELYDAYAYVMPSEIGGVSYKDHGQWRQKGDYFRYYPELSIPILERVNTQIEQQRYGDGRFIRYSRIWPTSPEYDRDAQGQIRMFQLRIHLKAPLPEQRPEVISSWSNSRKRDEYDSFMTSTGHLIPKIEVVNSINSRFGFMWRGIERTSHDRELGIGGGEVLIFDLQTNEVMAVRRNFRLSGTYKGTHNVNWLMGQQCLNFDYLPLHKKVLKPTDPYQKLKLD